MENNKATLVLESVCQECFEGCLTASAKCTGCGIDISFRRQIVAVKDGKVVAWIDE